MASVSAASGRCVLASVSEADPEVWDALAADAFFASSRWLRGVEEWVRPHRAAVLVHELAEPVAGMVVYLVDRDAHPTLDPVQALLGGEVLGELSPFQSAADAAETRKLAGRLSATCADRYPLAVCVCPYSCTVGVVGEIPTREVADALADALLDLAADWGAGGWGLLYLDERRAALAEALRGRGALSALLGARCVLPVDWASLDGYVASLPRNRRTKVRRELRSFARSGLRISIVDGGRVAGLAAELAPLYARQQAKYGQHAGADAARETIAWIGARFTDATTVVVVEDDGRPVAFHLLFEFGGRFYSYIGGQTYEPRVRDAFAFFQAVFYEPISLAAGRAISSIDYGLESYDGKVARGSGLEPLTGFLDVGPDARDELARLLDLVDAAQRERLRQYAAPTRRNA